MFVLLQCLQLRLQPLVLQDSLANGVAKNISRAIRPGDRLNRFRSADAGAGAGTGAGAS